MRLCRFRTSPGDLSSQVRWGLYSPQTVTAVDKFVRNRIAGLGSRDSFENLFPIDSEDWKGAIALLRDPNLINCEGVERYPTSTVELLPPIARPPKLLMLAGNYAEHVREQGDLATERENTFPYVFMKPPTTTLIGCGAKVVIPKISPSKIDHEVELAVVIGRRARNVSAADALRYVAGYTVINDISDRGYKPNPNRQTRPRDGFFDWLHGKWHDGFCPCGPCFVTSDEIDNPQDLRLKLSIDGDVRQDGCTSQMVFSIAEVIEFVSRWMTLEPGDILSTGTPSGVGNATGKYLAVGQTMTASIAGIGELVNPIVGEE